MDAMLSFLLAALITTGIWYLIAIQSTKLVPWLLSKWKRVQKEQIGLQRNDSRLFIRKREFALKRVHEIMKEGRA